MVDSHALPLTHHNTIVQVLGSYIPELFKIARERGVAGLYSGLLPTLVRAFPANAALFLGVETGKKFFDKFLWAP